MCGVNPHHRSDPTRGVSGHHTWRAWHPDECEIFPDGPEADRGRVRVPHRSDAMKPCFFRPRACGAHAAADSASESSVQTRRPEAVRSLFRLDSRESGAGALGVGASRPRWTSVSTRLPWF